MKHISQFIYESLSDSSIFVIIKPGFFEHAADIISIFKNAGWSLERQITKQLTEDEAKELYKIHKDEDWYDDLVEYMSSDKSTGLLFKGDKKVTPKTFDEIGSIKDNIRDKWGEDEMHNVIHSSDSIAHMYKERSIYFSYV